MPDEIFIIVVVAIIAGTFTTSVKAVLGYLQSRGGSSPSGGVTTSELEALMRRAVEEGTAPLHARLDELERKALSPAEGAELAAPKRITETAP